VTLTPSDFTTVTPLQTSTRSRRCRCERNHDNTKPSGSAWFRNTNTDPLSLPVSLWCNSFSFYRATLCVSTIFAVWCLSVCLSEYIVKLLCRPNSHSIFLIPSAVPNSKRNPRNTRGGKILGFPTEITVFCDNALAGVISQHSSVKTSRQKWSIYCITSTRSIEEWGDKHVSHTLQVESSLAPASRSSRSARPRHAGEYLRGSEIRGIDVCGNATRGNVLRVIVTQPDYPYQPDTKSLALSSESESLSVA